MKKVSKQQQRTRRHNRIRSQISGTKECPRLCVFRSNKALYAQLVNDEASTTLCATDTRTMKGDTPRVRAAEAGEAMAVLAKKAGIEKVVFDRGGFLYAGAIKEFADGARKGGLQF